MHNLITAALVAVPLHALSPAKVLGPDTSMSFFITSAGSGRGGDLGGLTGADAHCATLAALAGATGKTWRAYLSTQGPAERAVSARERIGGGPWHNAKGALIARDLDHLHRNPNLRPATALDEHGNPIPFRPGAWHTRGILTGSTAEGLAFSPRVTEDRTCGNWTRSAKGSAMAARFDDSTASGDRNAQWMVVHPTHTCSLPGLRTRSGEGRFMCFAVNP